MGIITQMINTGTHLVRDEVPQNDGNPVAPTPSAAPAGTAQGAQQQTPSTTAPVSGSQAPAVAAPPPAAPAAAAPAPAPVVPPATPDGPAVPDPEPGGIVPTSFRPAGYTPTNFVPTTASLTPDETVEARAARILKDGSSPLLEWARSQAMQQANARGLGNSSIAAGAGTEAMIKQALNIASQDAQSAYGLARANQGYENQAGQFNAQNQSEASRFDAASQNEFLGREQAAQLQARQTELANRFAQDNARLASALDTASRERLMAIEQNYRQITNGSQASSSILGEMQRAINIILADANIDVANKQGLIDKVIESSTRSARLIGAINAVDLSDILDF